MQRWCSKLRALAHLPTSTNTTAHPCFKSPTKPLKIKLRIMASFEEIPLTPKSNGMAKILAIGTANPPYATYQTDFPDFYFGATNTQHLTPLNAKFKRICEKSMIRKRHLIVNEEILKENQNMIDYEASSLTTRLALLATEVPKLGKEASEKAIKEWGQPKSKITHVVFGTNSYLDTPGPDHYLVKLLGLEPSVKRFLLREGGCHSGGTLLRLAKDMAENNPGARVLVVCVEVCSIICFGALKETNLLPHALFGDGAGAMIVGADPDEYTEQPIFELVSAGQTILPDTEGAIHIRVREMGKNGDLSPDVPKLIAKNTEDVLLENFKQFGIDDWNSLFWIAHPGGPAILNQIEAAIGLEKSKLGVTRHVLGEFGNMWGATVMFVLDEMRKRSLMEGKTTTGEGLEWGVLIGFGPGITVETIVLRSISLVK